MNRSCLETSKKGVCSLLLSTDERQGGTVVAAIELARASACEFNQIILSGPTESNFDYLKRTTLPVFRTPLISRFGFSVMPNLARELDQLCSRFSILHLNGVWYFHNLQAMFWARKNRVPVVWTVHGELDPVRLRLKRFKKLPFMFFGLPLYRKTVSAVRAITDRERKHIMKHGFGDTVKVIPNGIVPPIPQARLNKRACKIRIGANPDQRVLLFASRISPEKGISELVDSFDRLAAQFPEWQMVVAGSTAGASPAWLNNVETRMSKNSQVRYIGHWPAAEKPTLFQAADCFILPSFSDVISLVVLEASSFEVPSVITEGCDFPELYSAGGGFILRHGTFDEDLRQILSQPLETFTVMGKAAHALVCEKYVWDKIGRSMTATYRELVNGLRSTICV